LSSKSDALYGILKEVMNSIHSLKSEIAPNALIEELKAKLYHDQEIWFRGANQLALRSSREIFSDKALETILNLSPHFSRIDLSCINTITDMGIKFLSRCTNLVTLNLQGCSQLTG